MAEDRAFRRRPLCVYCRQRPADHVWRPFCSERCKLLDLRNWVDERYRVAGEPVSSLPHQDDPSDRPDEG